MPATARKPKTAPKTKKKMPRKGATSAVKLSKDAVLSQEQIREVVATCIVGAGAIYLILLLLPGNGTLATPIHETSFYWVGIGAWILGVGCCISGVHFFDSASWNKGLLTAGGTLVTTFFFLGLVSFVNPQAAGVIGTSFGHGIGHILGNAAAGTTCFVVTLLGLVMTANIRLSHIVLKVVNGAKEGFHFVSNISPDHEPSDKEQLTKNLKGVPMPIVPEVFSPKLFEPHATDVFPNVNEDEPDESITLPDVFLRRLAEHSPFVASAHEEDTSVDPQDGGRVQGELSPSMQTGDDEDEVHVWRLPPVSLLDKAERFNGKRNTRDGDVAALGKILIDTLASFGIEASIVGVSSGPTVTQFEIRPAPGVSVKKILNHQSDLSLAVAAPVRIQPFLLGKSAISIEVPHKATHLVSLREVVTAPVFGQADGTLKVVLGADVSGAAAVGDLTQMPHLLVAGATGSGKSVLVNSLIAGFLLQLTPAMLRLILIDPKRVELAAFADIPHLLVPVVVEPPAAVSALRWAVKEMEDRYKLLASNGVRNIARFNEVAPTRGLQPLPYIVIVIDELADLMMVAAGEIEELVCRLAQLARAVGIHLVVATQRPSTDIITGLIKANIPSRIAFAVSSGIDSRVILDETGAEKLLGRGDMLYLPIGEGRPRRLQGAYVSDHERDAVIDFWKRQGPPNYETTIFEIGQQLSMDREAKKRDPLFSKAAHVVATEGRGATSLLQRKLGVGYARAARLIDQLAEYRVVGPFEGSKSREVLMDLFEVDELLDQLNEDAGDGL